MLATACSDPLTFRLDPALDAQAFHDAADAWNARTTSDYRITFGNDGPWYVFALPPYDGWNGRIYRREQIVLVKPGLSPEEQYLVALHEFGHALGLKHGSAGIMDPTRATGLFSPEDIAQCKAREVCW